MIYSYIYMHLQIRASINARSCGSAFRTKVSGSSHSTSLWIIVAWRDDVFARRPHGHAARLHLVLARQAEHVT